MEMWITIPRCGPGTASAEDRCAGVRANALLAWKAAVQTNTDRCAHTEAKIRNERARGARSAAADTRNKPCHASPRPEPATESRGPPRESPARVKNSGTTPESASAESTLQRSSSKRPDTRGKTTSLTSFGRSPRRGSPRMWRVMIASYV